MYTVGALISAFITAVLTLLFLNVSSYLAARYATEKEKNPTPDYNELTVKERIFNFMIRVSYTPIAASLYVAALVFLGVFFESERALAILFLYIH